MERTKDADEIENLAIGLMLRAIYFQSLRTIVKNEQRMREQLHLKSRRQFYRINLNQIEL